jgi:hypothetical protein
MSSRSCPTSHTKPTWSSLPPTNNILANLHVNPDCGGSSQKFNLIQIFWKITANLVCKLKSCRSNCEGAREAASLVPCWVIQIYVQYTSLRAWLPVSSIKLVCMPWTRIFEGGLLIQIQADQQFSFKCRKNSEFHSGEMHVWIIHVWSWICSLQTFNEGKKIEKNKLLFSCFNW